MADREKPTENEINEVEMNLKEYMAKDLELVHGEEYMITDYMFIAECIDVETGKSETLYSHGNNTTMPKLMGFTTFVDRLLTERLRKSLRRE
jgi:hypothetical protein